MCSEESLPIKLTEDAYLDYNRDPLYLPNQDNWPLFLYRSGQKKLCLNITDTGHDARTRAKQRALKLLSEIEDNKHHRYRAQSPAEVSLLNVLNHYLKHRLKSDDAKSGCQSAILCLERYFVNRHGRRLDDVMTAEFSGAVQRDLIQFLAQENGPKGKPLSFSSLLVYSRYYRAALNYACQPDQIRRGPFEIEDFQLLSHADHFAVSEEKISEWTGLEPPQKGVRDIPLKEDFGRFFDSLDLTQSTDQGLFRYMILALNTGARARHILECDFRDQDQGGQVMRDRAGTASFINLKGHNVSIKASRSKRRPTIRLTENLDGWLQIWCSPHPVAPFLSATVSNIRKLVDKRCRPLGIPVLRPHLVRDFVATHLLKNTKDGGLGASIWLGHLERSKASVTTLEHYLGQDPDYLQNESDALDILMCELDELTSAALFPT